MLSGCLVAVALLLSHANSRPVVRTVKTNEQDGSRTITVDAQGGVDLHGTHEINSNVRREIRTIEIAPDAKLRPLQEDDLDDTRAWAPGRDAAGANKNRTVRNYIHGFAAAEGLDVQEDWRNPIPGHTCVGGPNRAMLRLADNHGVLTTSACENLKKKFLDIVDADVMAGTASAREKADGDEIKKRSAQGDSLVPLLVAEVISQDGVDEALRTDNIITDDDIQKVWQCEAGKTVTLDRSADKFEGDILVGGENSAAILAQFEAAINASSLWYGTVWNTQSKLGRIPYCFSSSVGQTIRDGMKKTIELFSQIPCIEFVDVGVKAEKTGTKHWGSKDWGGCNEHPSVIVRSDNLEGDGCYAYVGMLNLPQGNSQLLNLGTGCESTGIISHEFGHALAMGHEHARTDRDKYITVHTDYVLRTAGQTWVDQVKPVDNVDTSIPYDVLSLMHYGNNGGWITVKPPNDFLTPTLGNRMGPTPFDLKQLGNMYSCLNSVKPTFTNAQLIDHVKYPGCFHPDNSLKSTQELPSNAAACAPDYCEVGNKYHAWAYANCPRMCDLCAGAPNIAGGATTHETPAPPTTSSPTRRRRRRTPTPPPPTPTPTASCACEGGSTSTCSLKNHHNMWCYVPSDSTCSDKKKGWRDWSELPCKGVPTPPPTPAPKPFWHGWR